MNFLTAGCLQKELILGDDSSMNHIEEFKSENDKVSNPVSIELNLHDNTINIIIKRFFVFIMFFQKPSPNNPKSYFFNVLKLYKVTFLEEFVSILQEMLNVVNKISQF